MREILAMRGLALLCLVLIQNIHPVYAKEGNDVTPNQRSRAVDIGIPSEEVPPSPSPESRKYLLQHYGNAEYLGPALGTIVDSDEDTTESHRSHGNPSSENNRRASTQGNVNRALDSVKSGLDLSSSEFVDYSLNMALTESYVFEGQLNSIIIELAHVPSIQAAQAIETIDRRRKKIAHRIIDSQDLKLRRYYNVPESMDDDEFLKRLEKYRKSGYVDEKIRGHDLQERVDSISTNIRYSVVEAARISQNSHLIPLLSSYLSLGGSEKSIAEKAQLILDEMASSTEM